MARTGRFGHLPGSAPDLTGTIVALMEAYERQRDSNIIDAWQNGGEFEGRPVTDERLMQWYKTRRSQFTKDDPEYDYWDHVHAHKFALFAEKFEQESQALEMRASQLLLGVLVFKDYANGK